MAASARDGGSTGNVHRHQGCEVRQPVCDVDHLERIQRNLYRSEGNALLMALSRSRSDCDLESF